MAATEEMEDLGLDAEDEALINEELGEEELDTEAADSGGDILPGDVDNFQEIPAGNEDYHQQQSQEQDLTMHV